jgi:hypothetical protein
MRVLFASILLLGIATAAMAAPAAKKKACGNWSSYEACIKGNQKLGNTRNVGAWCSLKCAGLR